MTEAEYVKDRNAFGPTTDSKDKMPEGNVRNGGNAQVMKIIEKNEIKS